MKIAFDKSFSGNSYRVLEDLGEVWPYANDIMNDEISRKINTELKSKFESVEKVSHIPFFIKFNDPADEAAFLLWSSDGVEI